MVLCNRKSIGYQTAQIRSARFGYEGQPVSPCRVKISVAHTRSCSLYQHLSAPRLLDRASDSLEPAAMFELGLFQIFASGPTSTGTMILAFAASTAPSSETGSTGCIAGILMFEVLSTYLPDEKMRTQDDRVRGDVHSCGSPLNQAALISIAFSFFKASELFGSLTVKMPLANCASILFTSASGGSVKDRINAP